MGERSLSGYTYHDRVAVGFYGEVYRAHDQDGVGVRIVHVDSKLAEHDGFADALLAQEATLRVLEHDGVVATRAIRRAGDGSLAVVTDAVAGPVYLDALVRDGGGKVPADIALSIAIGAIEGLAYAHSLQIVHGCVHPRSVMVDFHGRVKLADFGLSLAYAQAVAGDGGGALATSAAGYLPPELAAGGPAVAGDVYGAGALLCALLSGAPSPAAVEAPAGLRAVIERAVRADPERRFLNGTELEEVLDEAVIAGGCRVAPPDEVAAFVTEQRSRAEADLDRETEDLLAEISSPEPAEPQAAPEPAIEPMIEPAIDRAALPRLPKPKTRPGFEYRTPSEADAEAEAEALAAVEDAGRAAGPEEFDSVADLAQAVEPSFAQPAAPEPGPLVDDALFELEEEAAGGEGDDSEVGFDDIPSEADHTRVDEPLRIGGESDPISQIIRLSKAQAEEAESVEEEEDTPLPEPVAHHERPGSITAALEAAAAQAAGAIAELEDQEDEPPRGARAEPSTPSDRPPGQISPATAVEPPAPPARFEATESLVRPRQNVLLWLSLSVAGAASLFGVLYTQTDMFHPERARAKEQERQRERQEALAEHKAEQPVPGEVVIDSTPGEAAVWLLLGRAPVESFPLPANMVHELRLEHDSYRPLDLPVTAIHWSDAGGDLRAGVRGKLVPGEPKGAPPAYPPQPEAPHPAAAYTGTGVIQVDSDPPGAQVWLLVGFTPNARLAGIEAGRDYEFKLLKDGYRPGFAVVRSDQWYLSGPGSPLRPSLSRSVELAPLEQRRDSGSERRRRGRRSGR